MLQTVSDQKGFKIVTVNTLHVHRSKELMITPASKDDKKDPRVIADPCGKDVS